MRSLPAVGRLRGKTACGRLRLWDALCQLMYADVCARGLVDVGIGERADTTVELLRWIGAPVVALEVHPVRVEQARARLAGLPVEVLETDALKGASDGPRGGLLRCANVLRQYPVSVVDSAHAALLSWVDDAGVVLEGSCDKAGHVGAMHILAKGREGPVRSALGFVTDFQRGFAPIQLRDHLPCDLRREVRAGGCMADFFVRWTHAWRDHRTGDPATDFRRAAEAMGSDVEVHAFSAADGGGAALLWRPPGGVPRPKLA